MNATKPMASIQLPTVAVRSQQTALQADVRTSLRFCNDTSNDVTISCKEDITRLRKEGNLWIIPASSCRMHVSVQQLGRTSSERPDTNALRSCIESCDIWERLNLKLRHCDTTDDRQLEFSVQHPDLSASLICPPTAAKAELQYIRCQIEVTRISDTESTKKRKRGTPDERGEKTTPPARIETSSCTDLSTQDRSAVHDFIAGLKTTSNNVPTKALERLLHAAMTAIITGSTRHYSDVSIRRGSTATALVRLMPAVFHVAYVRNIADRVQHSPVIASALTAMHNTAQSPALKRKTGYLAEQDDIETKLWCSILSTVKPPHVPGPKMIAANSASQETKVAETIDHGLGASLVSFGEGLLSSYISSNTGSNFEILSSQESLPTVQIDRCVFDEVLPVLDGHPIDSRTDDVENLVVIGSGALTPPHYL